MAPELTILIPAFNEEAALPAVLAELPKGVLARLVVVDNASSDATSEVARAGAGDAVAVIGGPGQHLHGAHRPADHAHDAVDAELLEQLFGVSSERGRAMAHARGGARESGESPMCAEVCCRMM